MTSCPSQARAFEIGVRTRQLDFGEQEPGMGPVKHVDLPLHLADADDVAPLLDDIAGPQLEQVARVVQRERILEFRSRDAELGALDGEERHDIVDDADPHRHRGGEREIGLTDQDAVRHRVPPAIAGHQELAFDFRCHAGFRSRGHQIVTLNCSSAVNRRRTSCRFSSPPSSLLAGRTRPATGTSSHRYRVIRLYNVKRGLCASAAPLHFASGPSPLRAAASC